jgi:hypothetical protein
MWCHNPWQLVLLMVTKFTHYLRQRGDPLRLIEHNIP